MENQSWKAISQGSPGSSPRHQYDVQSTYVPPEPSYEDPFAPASSNTFADRSSGTPEVVAAAEVPSTTAVHAESAPSSSAVLQFHESGISTHNVSGKMGGRPVSAPDVPQVQAQNAAQRLLGGFLSSTDPNAGDGGDSNQPPGLFSLRRYRKHFNVDTSSRASVQDVLGRMLDSVIGSVRPNFLEKTADSADLYGPFWVATTLIFVSAVTGNYASYISYRHNHTASTSAVDTWYYDINKVGYSAVLFYGYVGVIGFLLFAVLRWWFKGQTTLVQTWCAYGYSLSIFIPMSFFCIFPIEVLRWSLVGAATITSGLFLLLNFRQPIVHVGSARALPVWLVMAGLHVGLGLALKLYFFHYSSTA